MRYRFLFVVLSFTLIMSGNSYAQYFQWEKIHGIPDFSGINAIHFLDYVGHPEIGFFCSGVNNSEIWRTMDSGNTWVRMINLKAVDFTFKDAGTGWLISGTEVYVTHDTGFTWFSILQKQNMFGGGINFNRLTHRLNLAMNNRDSGGSYFSDDEGKKWQQYSSSIAFDGGFAFVDDLHGITTGTILITGQKSVYGIMRTSDGGITWTFAPNGIGGWQLYARKGTSTFFCMSGESVYRSDDYGATWSMLYTEKWYATGSIVGDLCGTLFIQNPGYTNPPGIVYSQDEGITWHVMYAGFEQTLMNDASTQMAVVGPYLYIGGGYGIWRTQVCLPESVQPIEQNNKIPIISIYPNPANEILTLNIESKVSNESNIFIYDELGREYYHTKRVLEERTELEIPIASLPEGSYCVVMKNANGVASSKFIKHK